MLRMTTFPTPCVKYRLHSIANCTNMQDTWIPSQIKRKIAKFYYLAKKYFRQVYWSSPSFCPSVCLSVCMAFDNAKALSWIIMKLNTRIKHILRTKPILFGPDRPSRFAAVPMTTTQSWLFLVHKSINGHVESTFMSLLQKRFDLLTSKWVHLVYSVHLISTPLLGQIACAVFA